MQFPLKFHNIIHRIKNYSEIHIETLRTTGGKRNSSQKISCQKYHINWLYTVQQNHWGKEKCRIVRIVQAWNRHADQWGIIDHPEISPQCYIHSNFGKSVKNILEKHNIINKWYWQSWKFTWGGKILESYLSSCIHQKWFKCVKCINRKSKAAMGKWRKTHFGI